MTWRAEDPQGNEAGKIKYLAVPYTRGRVLDLGCGPFKAFPHFTGVDNCKDVELFGVPMEPDMVVETCEALTGIEDASCDAVFSSHLLEHIEDAGAALAEWWRVIKEGGYLVLYLPHADLYPRIGEPGSNIDHKHDFMPEDVCELMRLHCATGHKGFSLLINETRSEGFEYSFFQVYQKGADLYTMDIPTQELAKKRACVVRYGGFGDQIQAANLLPELKRQGYHVTFMTTPSGRDILEHDPHIDDWIIQDKDQVPNHELTAYWAAWEPKFDKFVNLSESVEGTLLAIPGRTNHKWPDAVRRARMNLNYLEWTAELAELPYKSEARFYPSQEETLAVRGLLQHYGGDEMFHVMWVLSGSSVHKFYPNQDVVIQTILDRFPDVRFYLVGDEACKILEAGWENHPRVTLLSGQLDIRGTLALANVVDCVIGPETGVMNAVAFNQAVQKVVFLSHSSFENLAKHWIRTYIMAPVSTPCYPCHRLHYSREFCPEDPATGASVCQVNIPAEKPIEALAACYRMHARGRAAA